MWDKIFSLPTARILVIVGFILGFESLWATIGHIGNEQFRLVAAAPFDTHSWHHFFREVGGDIGAMVAILLLLFAAPKYRNPVAWWTMLVLAIGYYAPFWAGTPFMRELAAPNFDAEINHLSQAIPTVIGILVARRFYTQRRM